MKLFILSFILSFLYAEPKLEGKWKMVRDESFENILTSNNFQMQDEQQQKALTETSIKS